MAKILIIDDELAIRGMLKFQLEKTNHIVIEAADGQEGLAQLQSQLPDLVFLDVMIPKMDGWQLCREIKSNSNTKNIPVVMLTSRNQKIEELRSWESGADEYLTKPWTADQVLEVTSRLLAAPKTRT